MRPPGLVNPELLNLRFFMEFENMDVSLLYHSRRKPVCTWLANREAVRRRRLNYLQKYGGLRPCGEDIRRGECGEEWRGGPLWTQSGGLCGPLWVASRCWLTREWAISPHPRAIIKAPNPSTRPPSPLRNPRSRLRLMPIKENRLIL